MEELTEDQIKHIQGIEFWAKAQTNFIDNILVSKENSERMVNNHQENIIYSNEQLPIERKYLVDGLNSFKEWCELNKIPLPEWAK